MKWPASPQEGKSHFCAAAFLLPGCCLQKAVQGLARLPVQGHDALAAALALDRQHELVAFQRGFGQANQLRDAQARCIKQLQQAGKAERAHPLGAGSVGGGVVGSVQQQLDLARGQGVRQAAPGLGAVDEQRRIALPLALGGEKPREAFQAGELAGGGVGA